MSNIYLLRHGETDWNREGRLQGSLDVPINPVGIRQRMVLRAQGRRIVSIEGLKDEFAR